MVYKRVDYACSMYADVDVALVRRGSRVGLRWRPCRRGGRTRIKPSVEVITFEEIAPWVILGRS